MEKVTIERLKFSILVFLQVFILVPVTSLWFVLWPELPQRLVASVSWPQKKYESDHMIVIWYDVFFIKMMTNMVGHDKNQNQSIWHRCSLHENQFFIPFCHIDFSKSLELLPIRFFCLWFTSLTLYLNIIMKHLHGMQVFDLIVDLIYDFFRSFKQLNFSSYLLRYSYWAVYDSIAADCQHLQSVHDVPHHYKLVSTRQGFKDPDRIILWSTDALSRYLIARDSKFWRRLNAWLIHISRKFIDNKLIIL